MKAADDRDVGRTRFEPVEESQHGSILERFRGNLSLGHTRRRGSESLDVCLNWSFGRLSLSLGLASSA